MKHTSYGWQSVRSAFIVAAVLLIIMSSSIILADTEIVGGQEASPGEWPWQVALVQAGASPSAGQFCGGSIIARDWVLTAAHCVETSVASDLDVIAGIHDLEFPGPGIRRVAVSQIHIHPDYDDTPNNNDIALLRLAQPIDERPAGANSLPITFVDLAPGNAGDLTGITSTVTGWGNRSSTGGEDFPTRLHEVDVPIISNAACRTSYAILTDNMLCAGFAQGGKDSCQGDSGGPLVRKVGANWQQVGVVSFGVGCAQPNFPGVYARVSRYEAWITSFLRPFVPTDWFYIPITLDVPPAVPVTPLVNGNFEQGPSVGWTQESALGLSIILNDFSPTNVTAHGGTWAAWLGGGFNETSIIRQQATVPSGQSVLSYYHWIGSNDDCGFDLAGIFVNNKLVHQYDLCIDTSTGGWVRKTVNLGAYAGQKVTLEIVVETDGSLNSNLFVDDVTFTSSMAVETPDPQRQAAPGDTALKLE